MLAIDFETRSMLELGGKDSVGLHKYALAAEPLMIAWAYDQEPVELHEFRNGSMPDKLLKGLNDPRTDLEAYNSAFERYVLQYCLGIKLPASRFYDPQVSARYLSLPATLSEVGKILNLPAEFSKDKRGESLIDLFSYPHKRRKKKGQPEEWYFNDSESHPDEWVAFCDYCKQDVRAEREIMRRLTLLGAYPLTPTERKLWLLDQEINDRGLPVDVDFVQKASRLATRSKKEAVDRQNQLTGLENANSNKQMLAWVRERGYEANSLRKEEVESNLLDTGNALTEEARTVLQARKEASSSSYKKLDTILRQVSPDGRLRNQFVFLGSSRCGRWASNSSQIQNFPRPDKKFKKTMDQARQLIYAGDYDGIVEKFGSVLLTIKSCLRTVFVAPPGYKMVVSDLSSIETRVIAWIADCQSLLDVFRNGKDAYLDFVSKMKNIPYDKLAADIKSDDPDLKAEAEELRQMGKPAQLGCGYQLGGGGYGTNKYGDTIKTGLFGYAAAMGVDLSQEESQEIVRLWREIYPEIPKFWYRCEEVVRDVLKGISTVRYLGPQDCIKVDKVNILDRLPVLRIELPSGRRLHYVDAAIEKVKMPWDDSEGNSVYRESLVYAGQDQTTKQWTRIPSRGGKLTENITQAIARDILGEGMLLADELDFPIVAHAHDEIITAQVDDPFAAGLEDLETIMGADVSWAPGLPLGAAGFEGKFYTKA